MRKKAFLLDPETSARVAMFKSSFRRKLGELKNHLPAYPEESARIHALFLAISDTSDDVLKLTNKQALENFRKISQNFVIPSGEAKVEHSPRRYRLRITADHITRRL